MVRWRGNVFKEYVRKELHCFSDGMAKAIKQFFKFFNITGHALTNITLQIVKENWNKWINPRGAILWGKCSNDVTANATTWPKSTLQHRRGTINISLLKTNDMTKWDLHSGVPLVSAWYMHPLTYPSQWGASKSPFFVSHQLCSLVGQWKGESGFFSFQY